MRTILVTVISLAAVANAWAQAGTYPVKPEISQDGIALKISCSGTNVKQDDGSIWCQLTQDFVFAIDRAKGQSKPIKIECSMTGKSLFFGPDGGITAVLFSNGNLQRCTPRDSFTFDLEPWQRARGGDPDIVCRGYEPATFSSDGKLSECSTKSGRFADSDGELRDCRGNVKFSSTGALIKSSC